MERRDLYTWSAAVRGVIATSLWGGADLYWLADRLETKRRA